MGLLGAIFGGGGFGGSILGSAMGGFSSIFGGNGPLGGMGNGIDPLQPNLPPPDLTPKQPLFNSNQQISPQSNLLGSTQTDTASQPQLLGIVDNDIATQMGAQPGPHHRMGSLSRDPARKDPFSGPVNQVPVRAEQSTSFSPDPQSFSPSLEYKPPLNVTSKVPDVNTPKLGSVSAKYESGTSGPGTISTGRGDPGGISYGTYQLSSNAGTLQNFIKTSPYGIQFKGLKPNSAQFKQKWKSLARQDPNFGSAQHEFIKNTHYDPIRQYADGLGIPSSPAINESLWSMGVQHGGAKNIIKKAGIRPTMNESDIVNKLYNARSNYVSGLKKLPSGTKASVLNRYKNERRDVLRLINF